MCSDATGGGQAAGAVDQLADTAEHTGVRSSEVRWAVCGWLHLRGRSTGTSHAMGPLSAP